MKCVRPHHASLYLSASQGSAFPVLCLSGGEAAAEDSLRQDHEAGPQEGCHGDDRRPRRPVDFGRPVCGEGSHRGPRAVQEAAGGAGEEDVVAILKVTGWRVERMTSPFLRWSCPETSDVWTSDLLPRWLPTILCSCVTSRKNTFKLVPFTLRSPVENTKISSSFLWRTSEEEPVQSDGPSSTFFMLS